MDKMIAVFIFIKSRLHEPSTMASIAALMVLAGIKLEPGTIQDVLNVGTVIFGSLGFFVKEAQPLTKV